MKKIVLAVGARPNFVKASAVVGVLRELGGVNFEVVHTGQHYDYNMSHLFFEELRLRLSPSHVYLNMKSTSYGGLGLMMETFSQYLSERKPDVVVVFGDVASTLACALVTKNLHYPLAHVEAGCRSFDRTMPEEINRVVTDTLSDLCFCNTDQDSANLIREGKQVDQIHVVGNTMVDVLIANLSRAEWEAVPKEPYVLATFHRPHNVDSRESISVILRQLSKLSEELPVIFPVHPRTRDMIFLIGEASIPKSIQMIEPLGYLRFIACLRKADLVITDSGGVQVEAAMLNVPCLTVRDSTEHPWTLGIGGNTLVKREDILDAARKKLSEPRTFQFYDGLKDGLKDGRAAHRIVSVLMDGRC